MVTRQQRKLLQSLVDQGLLSERAMRRYLMPADELAALLDSDAKAEVVADLNAVLNAVMKVTEKRRRR